MTTARQAGKEAPWKIFAYAVLALAATIGALSLPLLIRAYLFQPFHVPAGSMIPTLLVGDYFFVSKYAYAGIWGAAPARGDVVAFLTPKDNATAYIKRVAGLPGDRIQMKAGMLHINGIPVAREPMPEFVGEDPCGSAGTAKTKRWRETLSEGVSYETLDCVDNGFFDNTNVYTVPAGRILVLGDNRDNSTDSRVLSAIGYVPLENVIGRAGMIFFSSGESAGIRWGRIGMLVR